MQNQHAFLVLETLAPTGRPVFVLREVCDIEHVEISEASTAVREITHRVRAFVAARRPHEAADVNGIRHTDEALGRLGPVRRIVVGAIPGSRLR